MANTTNQELELAVTHLTRAAELASFFHHGGTIAERIRLAKRLVVDIQREITQPQKHEDSIHENRT